ncbi:HAMP domain-containing sensor histidine kinase [Neobacillus sp. PS3-12]|uniref:sensor histidine kinase n=1 Tax=Neobacillus sp. PS3-12 TaxID=3070677 RepID=UPI0027DEEFA6|nr:HAMP domain-containing sensor histidine kinase [Neobacillus sp. PS3-12]WML51459.1 HAMP domain-containing sensor histidine kinase [Neobacillus sp. PS3-12]
MKGINILNRISIKLGLLFSGVFLILLLILGTILYGVFTNLFVDFVSSDLIDQGSNHSKVLDNDFSKKMIGHVVSMDQNGSTQIVITDENQKILGSTVPLDAEMKKHLLKSKKEIVISDWKKDKYISTITTIPNKGYVYMFYRTNVLRETVSVLKSLILVTGIGTVFIGFGTIGFLSRKITQPLVIMKEATNQLAKGQYRQEIPSKGNDEIAQLASSIQQLGEQLQYFEDTRNEFLSAVSHELRTPLTYIKGYSDVLSKGIIKSKEEQTEYLAIINRETKRISFLVNDLFEMSKLQAGKFQLQKELANVNLIAEKVASSLRPALVKKGLELILTFSEKVPPILIDVQRMEQVVYNLVENAIKYTDNGFIKIRSFLENEFVVIEICDTGMGIPKEEISKIWDRFYRIEKSRARKTGGTGLGLYIAKQIIESHHGQIKISSVENQGSTFLIYLPRELKE